MTLPFVKNYNPPTVYGVSTKLLPASWDSHAMWRRTRHIPSSKVYPAFVEKCPTCNQPRPPEDRRPADPYAPPPPATVAPAPDLWDMVSAQAQNDLDNSVMADLQSTAEALKEPTVGEAPPSLGSFAQITYDLDHYELPKARKAKCPGPGCRKNARESSPYCSKVCSGRCLRLRKKTTPLTKVEAGHLYRIETALANWGK